MKQIDGVWHICRDGWVYVIATPAEKISHVFNGMSLAHFNELVSSS
jgi:hypothetical protein